MRKNLMYAILPLAVSPMAAHAQADDGTRLEEVVVTAQRVSENLQSVPIAVTAVSGDSLVRSGVTNGFDVAQRVPSLTVVGGPGPVAGIFLRGIGSGGGAGGEPGVATVIDDVYQASSFSGWRDYASIASVEILKGPQGTLFGRNATGGVINIRTKDPSLTRFQGDATISYENYKKYTAEIYTSVPLSDTFAVNLAAKSWRQSDGWGVNIPTGKDNNKGFGSGFRTKALWAPTDATRVRAAFSYDQEKGSFSLPQRIVPGTYGRGDFRAETTYPGLSFWDTTAASDGGVKSWSYTGSLKIEHDLEAVRLVSITAITSGNVQLRTVNSPAVPEQPAFQTNYDVPQTDRYITQEFQLLSPSDSALQWLVGAFYLNGRSRFHADFTGTAFTALSGNGTASMDSLILKDSYSAFGQATADVAQNTKLTLGLRYTADKSSIDGRTAWNRTGALGPIIGGPFQQSKTWKALTWRAALSHNFSEDLMGYVAYNRGFKSGLYNSSAIGPSPAPLPASPPAAFPAVYRPANPEKLDAYTIGLKSEFAGGSVRLNAEAFYYDYQGIQFSIVVPGGTAVSNASTATIKGIDIDATWRPVRNLTFTGGLIIQEGSYGPFTKGLSPAVLPWGPNTPIPIPAGCGLTSYPVRPAGNTSPATTVVCDFNNNKTVKTPPMALNVAADYHLDLTGGAGLDFTASVTRSGHFFNDADNSPVSFQPYYTVLNGSVQWTSPDERYTLRGYVRNLTNEKYYLAANVSGSAGAKYSPAAPRTYGATLGVHW